jgi:signal transduction histidine kinase/CheY-like chemotaxis protein
VQASNSDGVWNTDGASLALVILPPWWGTWWAYTLYGVLTLALLYGLRRYDRDRLRLESRLAIEGAEAEQLRELEHARSRFFANVSHEFRTPLTLTLGPLDDLRSGLHGPLTPEVTEQVELARRSAGRVLNLIEQILELTRLEAGRTRLRARRLDVVAFAREIALSFAQFAERKSIAFDVQLPAHPIEIYADPAQLEKVLSNLLSNAFKFTPAGRAVRLTVELADGVVHILIRDSGPGIPAAELPHIFERFHRVENDATDRQPGTGIGLALARELVDLHGGSLAAESESGFGSTFTVTLRLGKAHLEPDQLVADDESAPWQASAPVLMELVGPGEQAEADDEEEDDVTTVLVVEDNHEVRAYIRKHLAPTYRVLEADDGQRGLEMTKRLLPDLVLSDVMMPGMDGYALCRAIKQDPETDFIPVVLLTARAAPEDRMEGLHGRADDYLTKPFDVPELLARVDNLIASRRLLRDRFASDHPAGVRVELHAGTVDVQPADERFLEQVRAAIEKNLADETFSVERLARAVAHSRGHLHRRLRELLGESPSDVIRRMRLERASQLLEADAGSVSTIAYAVGFKSLSHFSNRFHEQFGVRPSAFRERST